MAGPHSVLGKRKLSGDLVVGYEGRRKADNDTESSSSGDEGSEDARAIFRNHFEARFAPLEDANGLGRQDSSSDTLRENQCTIQEDHRDYTSDWEGLSDGSSENHRVYGQERNSVQVVEYHEVQLETDNESKAERKAFMRIRPQSLDELRALETRSMNAKNKNSSEDEQTESLNLKNDLELQRLISESHLLDASNARNLQNQRHKILDVRLQALGSKKSVLDHKNSKMSMAMRKGFTDKANEREAKRHAEAKENGIVLERPAHKIKELKTGTHKMRKGGLSDPAVGKFRGGATLQLSKKDIAEIRGTRSDVRTRRTAASMKYKRKVKKKG